jgi:hypothetical protein
VEIVEIKIGPENFGNYRRLSYKWWYALAEFVDNSSQSYLDNRTVLDTALEEQQEPFKVTIATDKDFVRIHDNAMGMDLSALRRAMIVGVPPDKCDGRCRYGLGMKTSACWIGNRWRIITTMLGVGTEYSVDIDVGEIVKGNVKPPIEERPVDKGEHYTIVEIREHNRDSRAQSAPGWAHNRKDQAIPSQHIQT